MVMASKGAGNLLFKAQIAIDEEGGHLKKQRNCAEADFIVSPNPLIASALWLTSDGWHEGG